MIEEIKSVKQAIVNLIDGDFILLSELINLPCWNAKQCEILKSLAVVQGSRTIDNDFIFDVTNLRHNN